jgi:hypothetical chaperone protein
VIEEPLTRVQLEAWIAQALAAIDAGVALNDVGSAFVPAVRRLFAARFGASRRRDELASVAKGLALRALDL